MKNQIEKQKQRLKDEFAKNLDQYFEKFSEMKGNRSLTIDEIERLWGEELAKTKNIIKEATYEATKTEDDNLKKSNAPIAPER